MYAWLEGAPDRVIVLHCKGAKSHISPACASIDRVELTAGKGRSGTLACSYLLSLEDSPTPPRLERRYSAKQWAKVRADELMQAMPDDETTVDPEVKEQALLAEIKAPTSKGYDTDETDLLKPPPPTMS